MKVRVGITNDSYMPFYNNCIQKFGWNSHKNCPNPGATVEILRNLLYKMNCTVELVTSPDVYGQKINDSTWTDILGSIYDGLFDISIFTLSPLKNRLDSFEFATATEFTPYAFYYKQSDDSFETYAVSLLKPFNKLLWGFISTVLILLTVAWLLISHENQTPFLKLLSGNFFTFVKMLQGDFDEDAKKFSTSKMFFFISLSLFTIVFSGLYQGALLVSFVKGKDPIMVSTFAELIHLLENNYLQVVTDDDQWYFFHRTINSDGDLFARMNKIFARNKYLKVNTKDEVYAHLMTGKYVYPAYSTYFGKSKERCGLGFMILDEQKVATSFVFRKNSSLLPLMNAAIAHSWDMISYYTQLYDLFDNVDYKNCSKNSPSSLVTSLSIYQLSGSLYLLLGGFTLSIFVYLYDIIKAKWKYKEWSVEEKNRIL